LRRPKSTNFAIIPLSRRAIDLRNYAMGWGIRKAPPLRTAFRLHVVRRVPYEFFVVAHARARITGVPSLPPSPKPVLEATRGFQCYTKGGWRRVTEKVRCCDAGGSAGTPGNGLLVICNSIFPKFPASTLVLWWSGSPNFEFLLLSRGIPI
jgi:hypothetical protein